MTVKSFSSYRGYTWDNLTESNTSEKKGLSMQLHSAEEEFKTLRKRHALGSISLDVYSEFAQEMEKKIIAISEELTKLEQNLSNPATPFLLAKSRAWV